MYAAANLAEEIQHDAQDYGLHAQLGEQQRGQGYGLHARVVRTMVYILT
jgi:hypothetical protein